MKRKYTTFLFFMIYLCSVIIWFIIFAVVFACLLLCLLAATEIAADGSKNIVVERAVVANPDPRCKKVAGYNKIDGSCTKYVFCIKGVVRFDLECDSGFYYIVEEETCRRYKPESC